MWAVDREAESIAFGRRKAQRLGITNITWTVGTAESVPLDGEFDLVAIGNAFQRLDRPTVAERVVAHLRPGGCMALLWGGTPWKGDRLWQRTLRATLERWMRRARRP